MCTSNTFLNMGLLSTFSTQEALNYLRTISIRIAYKPTLVNLTFSPDRVNFQKQSRTMVDRQSPSKSKRWSGPISPCRVCMKTPQMSALRSEASLILSAPPSGRWSKIYKRTYSFIICIKMVSLFWYKNI